MSDPACEITGLEKAFGANKVLRGVDLTLPGSTITVLMGANGAGKSTLVKVLCGVHGRDAGSVRLNGAEFDPVSPADAIRSGVVTVHQSINDGVIPDLDVASNLMLDRLTAPGAGLWVRGRALRQQAQKIAEIMALDIDPRTSVRDLSLADRQLIAIARAMAHTPSVLILDEPTSSLSAAEAERLFELLFRLKQTGVAILYISHRMSDIRAIADRVVSMRDGKIAGIFEENPLDLEGAVTAMLGQGMTDIALDAHTGGAPILELDEIVLQLGVKPISLTARDGEVIAITGLVGSGKSDLADVLFGQGRPVSGAMRIGGVPYAPTSAADAIANGLFLCPKDRAQNGVVPIFDITGNATLPFLSRHAHGSFLRPRSERATMTRLIDELGIVCQGPRDEIGALSGGNQQKVMVGRWLAEASRVLVLDEPFQGVDIRARRDIGARLRDTAPGRATIVFVAELDEALEIADRIVVMGDHSLRGDHHNDSPDLEAILAQVTGTQEGPRIP